MILAGVLRDQWRLAAMEVGRPGDWSRGEWGRRRAISQRAKDGLVPMDVASWLGHEPTNSDRVLVHRDIVRLEDMGLLARCNVYGGRRATHIRLTDAGQGMAETLLDEECSTDVSEEIDWSNLDLGAIELSVDANDADDWEER